MIQTQRAYPSKLKFLGLIVWGVSLGVLLIAFMISATLLMFDVDLKDRYRGVWRLAEARKEIETYLKREELRKQDYQSLNSQRERAHKLRDGQWLLVLREKDRVAARERKLGLPPLEGKKRATGPEIEPKVPSRTFGF